MTLRKPALGMHLVVAVAVGAILSGCCKDEKKKAADLESKVTAMESEITTLKTRISTLEPLEKELEACNTSLEDSKSQLGKQTKQQELMETQQKTIKRLLDKLKGVIEAGELSVRIRQGRMVIELPSAVLFASGKADLSDKGKGTLDSVAEVLKEIKDRKFQVAGHTDNVPVSEGNPFGSNWHLSTARAIAVVEYLRTKGLNPRNLSAAGYAQFQPLAKNNSPQGKARNRRIEITLMPNLAELPDLSRMEKKLGLVDPVDVAY